MGTGVFSRPLCRAPCMYGNDFSGELFFFQFIDSFIHSGYNPDELADLQFHADELLLELFHAVSSFGYS